MQIPFNRRFVFGIVVLLSVLASIQSYRAEKQAVDPGGPLYNHYNNFTIYQQSFFHLIDGKDLYIKYPYEHWDLYKYTPSFSVLFGLLALFPDWLGLNLWNLINALVLLLAIYYLPRQTSKDKAVISFIVLIELLTALQNEQSNALMAGLLVLAFGLLERKHYFFATAFLVFSVFIKLFGLVGFALFLLYPEKWKFIRYSAFWALVFFLLPLIFVSPESYLKLYESFWLMLQADHLGSAGLSVMGWLETWFGLSFSKNTIVFIGAAIFMTPFLRMKAYQRFDFRILILSSILVWVVIFNHKAESPTFVIAMTGVALWFMQSEKNWLTISVLVLALVFTSLSPSDLFPRSIRENLLIPYVIKVVPCMLVWTLLIYQLLTSPFLEDAEDNTTTSISPTS